MIDETGIVQSFNPAAESIFGYKRDEVIGRNVSMLMPEPYRSAHDSHIGSYLRTGEAKIIGVSSRELLGMQKDGSVFPMELSVGEMPHQSGRTFVGTVRDITERKQRESALIESEERFQLVTDALPVLISYVDRDERYVMCNKAHEDWFGLPIEQIVGQHTRGVVGEEVYRLMRDATQDALSGKTSNIDCELPFRHGRSRYVHATYVSHTETEGEVLGYFSLTTDLTERRQSERRLRQAYKLEAIGQLTGGVAHDFNNLLGVLMMDLAELKKATGTERDELVDEALAAVRSATDLTQHLLAFSRKQPLEPKLIKMPHFLDRTLALLRRTLGEDIGIDSIVAGDLYDTRLDLGLLENALLNLAVNARDAMPSGGKLTIRAQNTALDAQYASRHPDVTVGDYAKLTVSDTGAGIEPAIMDKVVEPFFTTKGPGSGTGLGLSMVYGFVKQSGGHISITSELGRGTTIDLFLPRASEVGEVNESSRAEEEVLEGNETVLLVEDYSRLRNRAAALLEELGYRVIQAENGSQALIELQTDTHFDLLLTDIVMPGALTGNQLAAKARELRPDIRVLYMSGYEETGAEDLATTRLRKPFSKEEVAAAIRRVLDGRALDH